MNQSAFDEYNQALKQGQKEYRERMAAGLNPHPLVLDELLPEDSVEKVVDVGLVDIPSDKIIGVKSTGRITAFSASFRPLLDARSEFGAKWVNLCGAHLGDVGITEPILCYEYLGDFYVQEGNKRVSVLRSFDAPRIPGHVKRVMPKPSEEPRIKAYYEFLEFYKASKLYTIQFRHPGDYARLLTHIGKQPGEVWTEDERRNFNAYFSYFRDAFQALHLKYEDILPGEGLLLWLEVYSFRDLGQMTATQIKKSIQAMWSDMVSSAGGSVRVQTKAQDESKSSLVNRIVSTFDQLDVAFVHQLDPQRSLWVMDHEEGREYIEQVFGDRIKVRSYYGADTLALAEEKIEEAVAHGAEVVFTTAPLLSRATLKAAVKYPKIRFLNCSVDQALTSVRSYYARVFEGKFITGAIAGAMADNNRIGYIASYPIYGVPTAINAFALGAQMTNPRAQIELRWSCVEGSPQADFYASGIRVVSNRDQPSQNKLYLDFCNYGTYLMHDRSELISLGSPVWVWGKCYEFVIRSILSGGWNRDKGDSVALNYWLGMDSGVIDLNLSEQLPAGVRQMAQILAEGIKNGTVDPFCRKIVNQAGQVMNDGTRHFTPEELLKMDWLCDNVVGAIPPFEEILPISRRMVRELGVYRDTIPPEKEQ